MTKDNMNEYYIYNIYKFKRNLLIFLIYAF